jgi:hypothetical protein
MVTNSFGNRTFMQPKPSRGLSSSLSNFRAGGGRILCSFVVLNVFPSSSQNILQVPNVFPEIVNNTSFFISYCLAMVKLSCIYQCWAGIKKFDTLQIQFSQNNLQKVRIFSFLIFKRTLYTERQGIYIYMYIF